METDYQMGVLSFNPSPLEMCSPVNDLLLPLSPSILLLPRFPPHIQQAADVRHATTCACASPRCTATKAHASWHATWEAGHATWLPGLAVRLAALLLRICSLQRKGGFVL